MNRKQAAFVSVTLLTCMALDTDPILVRLGKAAVVFAIAWAICWGSKHTS